MIVFESIFSSREGRTLRTTIRFNKTGVRKPVILLLHGLNGFKDWGSYPYIMTALAEAGFVTIAMSFSGCGVTDASGRFTELAAYSDNTISQEIEETADMLRIIISKQLGIDEHEYDADMIGLLGHSIGAGIALIAAAERHPVRCLALWTPAAAFDRFSERQKQEWRERGYFDRENSRTHQRMRMNRSLLDDIEEHSRMQTIMTAARRIARQLKPVLIIAASEDMTTPLKEAELLHRTIPQSALQIIERTGHTFGAKHPFTAPTPALETALMRTKDFFLRQLRRTAAA
jgi:pimeloyl-ACP methyl ester carboxylesterase